MLQVHPGARSWRASLRLSGSCRPLTRATQRRCRARAAPLQVRRRCGVHFQDLGDRCAHHPHEGGVASLAPKKALPTALFVRGLEEEQPHHVVDVDHRQQPLGADLQDHSLLHQLEEGEVLVVPGADDPARAGQVISSSGLVGERDCSAAAFVSPYHSSGGAGLLLDRGGWRSRARRRRGCAKDQPPRAGLHHRVGDVPRALGVHPHEVVARGRAANAGQVVADVDALERRAQRLGLGDVAVHNGDPLEVPPTGESSLPSRTRHFTSSPRSTIARQPRAEEAVCSSDEGTHSWELPSKILTRRCFSPLSVVATVARFVIRTDLRPRRRGGDNEWPRRRRRRRPPSARRTQRS